VGVGKTEYGGGLGSWIPFLENLRLAGCWPAIIPKSSNSDSPGIHQALIFSFPSGAWCGRRTRGRRTAEPRRAASAGSNEQRKRTERRIEGRNDWRTRPAGRVAARRSGPTPESRRHHAPEGNHKSRPSRPSGQFRPPGLIDYNDPRRSQTDERSNFVVSIPGRSLLRHRRAPS